MSESLDTASARISIRLDKVRKVVVPYFEHLLPVEYWRWLVGLISAMLVIYVWVLLIGATCCGCCGAERSSSPTLILTMIILAIASVGLWFISFVTLYIGGHGETHICRTLHEGGDYPLLTLLTDTFTEANLSRKRSYLSELFYDNGSLEMPFGTVLRDCQNSEPVYQVFQLKQVLDVENAVNISSWPQFSYLLNGITVNMHKVEIFSPKLNLRLMELQDGLKINITSLRAQLVGPACTDLDTISTHLRSISKQVKDVSTKMHLEVLANRSKMMFHTIVQDLESQKENLIYHLTALELKMGPMLRQVNHSITHMKAVQYYVTNHGDTIAEQTLKSYKSRMENYIEQYQNYVLVTINSNKTSCRPFWDMYNSLRLLICRQTLDPLNGFWFSTIYCLLIFIIITPIGLKLIEYYNLASYSQTTVSLSESMMAGDDSVWSIGPSEGGENW